LRPSGRRRGGRARHDPEAEACEAGRGEASVAEACEAEARRGERGGGVAWRAWRRRAEAWRARRGGGEAEASVEGVARRSKVQRPATPGVAEFPSPPTENPLDMRRAVNYSAQKCKAHSISPNRSSGRSVQGGSRPVRARGSSTERGRGTTRITLST